MWVQFLNDLQEFGVLYIPASRAMTSVFLNIYNEQVTSQLDITYKQYLNMAAASRKNWAENTSLQTDKLTEEQLNFMQLLYTKILQAKYVYKENKDQLITIDEQEISVRQGSSGQQEILWLLNIVYDVVVKHLHVCFIIEEPETNLFPATQCDVLKYIIAAVNISNNEVIITTHSPYMLTAANMLLYAGANKKYVANEVEEQCQIKPVELDCYYLEQGLCKSIYKKGEINANYIDSITEIIYGNIDKIMDRKLMAEDNKDAL